VRANAIAIYLGDPDCNLIEVRTYARRSLVRIAIGDARQLVRDAIDATQSPDSAVVGNEAWTRKELLAHLTRSKAGFANRLRLPPTRVREILSRSMTSMPGLLPNAATGPCKPSRKKLHREAAALQASGRKCCTTRH
jgi:hypothetical protein